VGVTEVVIALGSNMGDSLGNLRQAVALLRQSIKVEAVSTVYETAPMYVVDQPPFLNAALTGATSLGPRGLLALLKELEKQIGRLAREVNGPREIDLDLIAYGRLSYSYFEGKELRLVAPHPRVADRRFVLQPLADIAPDLLLPGIGVVRALLGQTEQQRESVKKTEHALLPVPSLE
jgi:2-amino-4-hydroxy-6-hydroxymethyldihydropteridine diphosphokinase